MEKIILNDKEYELIKDYKNGFDKEEVANKFTDYFDNFDYVCGDWAYGKLRLKGFYDHKNKQVKEYNDYNKLNDYLKNNCAKTLDKSAQHPYNRDKSTERNDFI